MEKLNILEKLDATLLFIISNNNGDDVLVYGRENYPEFLELLEKLAKDGYTKRASEDENNHVNIPTVEGRIFSLNGGYVRQKEFALLSQSIAENDELTRQRNDRLLVFGTWFAGITAALLLLWQVFLWFYPHYSDYPYTWIWEQSKRKALILLMVTRI